MAASLTASGTSIEPSVAKRDVRQRALHWRGWPACAPAAKLVGVGYLATTLVLVSCGLVITDLLSRTVGRWDDQVNTLFARNRTPTGNWITGYVTVIANTRGIVGVAVVVSAIAVLRRRATLAVLLVTGLAFELAAFLAANYIVARPRPHVVHLGSTPSTYSWPSGHVAATFVLYGGIALIVTVTTSRLVLRILAWTLASVVTACVGISRVYRGDHHPTDAIAGLVLGFAALSIATLAVRTWTARVRSDGRSAGDPAHSGAAEQIAGPA